MNYNNYWNFSGRFINKVTLLKILHHTFVSYKAPASLSYFWNFGVLAVICLAAQIVTGIFLAMHYVPSVADAFNSVEHIMRDVNYGWLLRYLHANGASMFFIVVYVHVFRGLYYGSYVYPRAGLWNVGIIILLIMILTAFMGYVLPWGQMSFWAATVITNLASAVPYIGDYIVYWLWGGYSVGAPTLNRFFSFHYLFPFIILLLVVIHLTLLHEVRSNNPLGVPTPDVIAFSPYYILKDVFGLFIFAIFFSVFLFYFPNYLGHTDNYIKANSMSTPTHIVPEWYFLPFYAILRSVPDKLGGVVLLLCSILVFLFLPVLGKFVVRSSEFRFFYKFFFWFFLANCLILGWIGGEIMEEPFLTIGRYSTMFYFIFVIFIVPFSSFLENLLWSKKKL